MRIIALTILCSVFCWVNSLAQDDDDKNERKVIEFSFLDYSFKKIFPFDEPFSIKLTDIKANTNLIKIRINQFNRNRKKTTVDSSQWTRRTATETSAMLTLFQLKPNSYYEFEIDEVSLAPLTAAQQSMLRANLTSDINVQNTINDLANYYINEYLKNQMVTYTDVLNAKSGIIKDNIIKAIKNTNPSYILNPVDPVTSLDQISNFTDQVRDIMDKLIELQAQADVKAKPASLSAVQSLSSTLKTVNWATISSGDADYNTLMTLSGNVTSAIGAGVLGTTSSKVTAIQTAVNNAITARDAFKNLIIDQLVLPNVLNYGILNSTTRTDFQKNSKFYITLDLGAAYAARIDRFAAYSGVNIYFRPVNKSAPLNNLTGLDWWAVRTSLLIGITLNSIEKDNIRKGLIDNKALVTGIGFRVVPFLKVNVGTFIHYRYDKNPLLSPNRYYTSLSPFASISLDMDAKALFSGIGNSIFK